MFRRRNAPAAAAERPVIRVNVTARSCPECGGELGEVEEEIVSTTDVAEQPQPDVQVYAVEVRRCKRCGKPVRGQHPGVASDQQGATAHRVGLRVKALAHLLHYSHGVPVRKVPAVIEELTGVQVTQGALTQDAMKQAGGIVGQVYQQLREAVGKADVVYTDDTGWRVGGDSAFLMVFTNPAQSVYQIRERHRNEEVREVIRAGFAGVMVCDRGKSYDAEELSGVAQQKCLAHLIRNAEAVATSKAGRAKQFSQNLKELLKEALGLAYKRAELAPADYEERVEQLDAQMKHHLRNRILRDDDNQRLLNGVGAQHDHGNLLLFLRDPRIEPTNNRAERALRPAVIARKVSHCSKTERGARTFEAFVSVVETLKKTCSPAGAAFCRLLAGPPAAASP
ncbi:MAG: IS66 family transposase [bacterium]